MTSGIARELISDNAISFCNVLMPMAAVGWAVVGALAVAWASMLTGGSLKVMVGDKHQIEVQGLI
jgi:hypothetical protein